MAGSGARGMLGIAFDMRPDHPQYEDYKEEFFVQYERRMTQLTHAFEGVAEMLLALQQRGLPWGIVTNKAQRFTGAVVQALGLHQRAACVVSGDTTPHAKPHPAPLLHAAKHIGIAPAHCLYVGDDLRDIQAANAAGMRGVAVRWGYLGDGLPPEQWGADALIDQPQQLLALRAAIDSQPLMREDMILRGMALAAGIGVGVVWVGLGVAFYTDRDRIVRVDALQLHTAEVQAEAEKAAAGIEPASIAATTSCGVMPRLDILSRSSQTRMA